MESKKFFNQLESDKNVNVKYYKAVNWNDVSELDQVTWDKLNSQFWLPERVPTSNDLPDWRKLPEIEQDVVNKAFVGLTLLDTLQSEEGALELRKDAKNQQELAIFNQINLMESIHAKSYSNIFISLNSNKKIDEIFEWGHNNGQLQYKAKRINEVYQITNQEDKTAPLKKKIASVFLESFLFYSGFYAPLWYLGNNKLINTANIIQLIIRDESVHGTYTGILFQKDYAKLSEKEQDELQAWMFDLLFDLYENEMEYTEDIYESVGWVDNVKTYVRYNANKALQNLGFDPVFKNADIEDVDPVVMNGISTESKNNDFFSMSAGNSYLMGEAEAMDDDDYDF